MSTPLPRFPQLVAALDSHDSDAILALAGQLRGVVPWVKVGLELYAHAGPDMLARLKDHGFRVFVDLKMFDIPNTVRGGVAAAMGRGADMLTIHTLGGEAMAGAALEAAHARPAAERPLLMGVTVLTSMDNGDLPAYTGDLRQLATHLAEQAFGWGLDGVVCSGHEVRSIKEMCSPDFLCLTPGIRPRGSNLDDQSRIVTPAQAVRAGANFLVVGRPISKAADPRQAAMGILQEMESAHA